MGQMEWGTCEVCNNEGSLNGKYFYYGVKCECHSSEHFQIVWHCYKCVPEDPGSGEIQYSNRQKHNLESI
jgi:hypothetical protein